MVVADDAGNSTASAPVTGVRVDNTAPAASLDDPGAYLRGTLALSASASDGGSGLASVTFQRSAAGANSWTTIASDSSAPYSVSFDTTAVADGSYDLRVVATDGAGNQRVSLVVSARTVDNTAPSTFLDAPADGTYLNAAAPDPLGLTASTPDTDVAQVEFFACDDASAGCATGSWVSVGTDTSAPYGAAWPLPAVDGVQALKAVATDHAGNSASSVVTVTIDRQAPSGGSVSYTNGYGSAPVTITVGNGSDVSGIDVASALLERDETTLANGSCDTFAGNWTTVTSPDSSVSSGHCYRYHYTVADNAGNAVTYTTGAVLKVDGSAPTVALDAGTANLRGTASLSATASDALSGVASVAFQRSPAGAATWTTISTDTSAPFAASFDTTAVADGLYDLRAVATDGSGATATDGASRRVDNTLPSGSLTAPADGTVVYGSVPVSSNSADSGSGVGSVAFESSPAGAGTWSTIGSDSSAPYSVSLDTTSLAEGEYDLRAVTTDAAGNTFTSPLRTVTVDNTLTAPTLTFGSFTNAAASGSTVYFRPGSSGGFTVTALPTGWRRPTTSTSTASAPAGPAAAPTPLLRTRARTASTVPRASRAPAGRSPWSTTFRGPRRQPRSPCSRTERLRARRQPAAARAAPAAGTRPRSPSRSPPPTQPPASRRFVTRPTAAIRRRSTEPSTRARSQSPRPPPSASAPTTASATRSPCTRSRSRSTPLRPRSR